MLVGEAPGETEDRLGLPFIGRSGKWLQKCINVLGLKNNVYITNVVKCKPPNNRKPKWKEIGACSKYLMSEIKLLNPKVIVAMGKVATEALAFKSIRGSEGAFFRNSELGNYYCISTWHPAYCLRTGRPTTTEFFEHLKLAKRFIWKVT